MADVTAMLDGLSGDGGPENSGKKPPRRPRPPRN
jgi:hypothetical protein